MARNEVIKVGSAEFDEKEAKPPCWPHCMKFLTAAIHVFSGHAIESGRGGRRGRKGLRGDVRATTEGLIAKGIIRE